MNYDVKLSPVFKREAKKLIKKYPSLKKELGSLITELTQSPFIGTPIGNGVYKIRLAIASKGRGKSGGARIISQIKIEKETVLLLSIYDKGDKETLPANKLLDLIKKYGI